MGLECGPNACTPSFGHTLEMPINPGDSAKLPAGCTTGCTSPTALIPEHPPSPMVAAMLALAAQLSAVDRRTLARLLLAGTQAKGDAG
jgi:hypothetical protein